MPLFRLFVVAVLVCALCGCQAIQNDPILGDRQWQPGDKQGPNG